MRQLASQLSEKISRCKGELPITKHVDDVLGGGRHSTRDPPGDRAKRELSPPMLTIDADAPPDDLPDSFKLQRGATAVPYGEWPTHHLEAAESASDLIAAPSVLSFAPASSLSLLACDMDGPGGGAAGSSVLGGPLTATFNLTESEQLYLQVHRVLKKGTRRRSDVEYERYTTGTMARENLRQMGVAAVPVGTSSGAETSRQLRRSKATAANMPPRLVDLKLPPPSKLLTAGRKFGSVIGAIYAVLFVVKVKRRYGRLTQYQYDLQCDANIDAVKRAKRHIISKKFYGASTRSMNLHTEKQRDGLSRILKAAVRESDLRTMRAKMAAADSSSNGDNSAAPLLDERHPFANVWVKTQSTAESLSGGTAGVDESTSRTRLLRHQEDRLFDRTGYEDPAAQLKGRSLKDAIAAERKGLVDAMPPGVALFDGTTATAADLRVGSSPRSAASVGAPSTAESGDAASVAASAPPETEQLSRYLFHAVSSSRPATQQQAKAPPLPTVKPDQAALLPVGPTILRGQVAESLPDPNVFVHHVDWIDIPFHDPFVASDEVYAFASKVVSSELQAFTKMIIPKKSDAPLSLRGAGTVDAANARLVQKRKKVFSNVRVVEEDDLDLTSSTYEPFVLHAKMEHSRFISRAIEEFNRLIESNDVVFPMKRDAIMDPAKHRVTHDPTIDLRRAENGVKRDVQQHQVELSQQYALNWFWGLLNRIRRCTVGQGDTVGQSLPHQSAAAPVHAAANTVASLDATTWQRMDPTLLSVFACFLPLFEARSFAKEHFIQTVNQHPEFTLDTLMAPACQFALHRLRIPFGLSEAEVNSVLVKRGATVMLLTPEVKAADRRWAMLTPAERAKERANELINAYHRTSATLEHAMALGQQQASAALRRAPAPAAAKPAAAVVVRNPPFGLPSPAATGSGVMTALSSPRRADVPMASSWRLPPVSRLHLPSGPPARERSLTLPSTARGEAARRASPIGRQPQAPITSRGPPGRPSRQSVQCS